MSIKRRLFLSNILMLIIPIVLSMLAVGVIFFVPVATLGIRNHVLSGEMMFQQAVFFLDELGEELEANLISLDTAEDRMRDFHRWYHPEFSLGLYQGQALIFSTAPQEQTPYLEAILSYNQGRRFIQDELAIYRCPAGAYSLVLVDTQYDQSWKVNSTVYQGEQAKYFLRSESEVNGGRIDTTFLDAIMAEGTGSVFMVDDFVVYRPNPDDYSLVLLEKSIWEESAYFAEYQQFIFNLWIIVIVVIIVIVLLTNRFLTRFVFKRVVTPLDTLTYGVRQIRDGNLDYRILYPGNDEFAAVCAAFNEMAEYLLASVKARQKNEESRKELVAGISHDLRTPLTSIKAYFEGLEKGVALTPQLQQRYWDIIRSKTNDLEHVIDQLFLFSKIDMGEFPVYLEVLDIGAELSDYVDMVRSEYAARGFLIHIRQQITGIYVEADRVQLRNIFTNIVENSVKYKVKTQGNMDIFCRAGDGAVTVSLEDDGPGVPEKSLSKLFDVFYRSDRSRNNPSQGSGLGLAITAKLLERFRAGIHAKNAAAGGLVIVLTFPVYTGGGGA